MSKIERILYPTDLSTDPDEALQHAVALAQAYEAKLLLLHCSEANPIGTEENKNKVDTQMTRLFRAILAPHVEVTGSKDLQWEGVVRNRVYHVGRAIVSEAATQKVDLIVMRACRRPRSAILPGSTTEIVCRNAPCPVFVAHPSEDSEQT